MHATQCIIATQSTTEFASPNPANGHAYGMVTPRLLLADFLGLLILHRCITVVTCLLPCAHHFGFIFNNERERESKGQQKAKIQVMILSFSCPCCAAVKLCVTMKIHDGILKLDGDC